MYNCQQIQTLLLDGTDNPGNGNTLLHVFDIAAPWNTYPVTEDGYAKYGETGNGCLLD